MTTQPSPKGAQLITKDCQPVFPAWLYILVIEGTPMKWARFPADPGGLALSFASHWLPGDLSQPTEGPDPDAAATEAVYRAKPVVEGETPTPRTDAHIHWQNETIPLIGTDEAFREWCNFARQLERELATTSQALAEARRQAVEAERLADRNSLRCHELDGQLADAQRERDRYKADLEGLATACGVSYSTAGFPWNIADTVKNQLRWKDKDITTLTQERDEARADSRRLQALAQIVWDARWGKGENARHSAELDTMVGIAAEIRSGNFASLDAALSRTGQGEGK